MKDMNEATPPRPKEEDYNLGDIAAGYYDKAVKAWDKAYATDNRGKRSNLIHREEVPKDIMPSEEFKRQILEDWIDGSKKPEVGPGVIEQMREEGDRKMTAEETEESRGGPEAISDALLNADERIDEHQYKELKRIDNRVEEEDIPGLKGITFAEQKDVYSIDVTKLKTIRDIRKFILSLNLVFSDPTDNMKEYLKKH